MADPQGPVRRHGPDLPHGVEYKSGLMPNARRWRWRWRWRWRDGKLSANYENRYGAVASVKFTAEDCVG